MELKDVESRKASHLVILVSYTVLSLMLIGECFILGWEQWPIPLIVAGVISSWLIHITEPLPERLRIWLYSILMMVTFFYYGIHTSSMYDLGAVIICVILIFSMSNEIGLINLCVSTYIITMSYDLIQQIMDGEVYDKLSITRLILHYFMVIVAGYITALIITKKKSEKERNNAEIASLQDVNRRTEDFLTNVSHELRTPINAVTGISSMMIRREESKPLRDDIIAIRKAGIRLMEQVGDILDYTEIDTGRITISEENYMIASVINDVIVEQRMRLAGKHLDMVFDVDARIPAMLHGDGVKIKKILRHILSNAIKFTENGGVYIRIFSIDKPYGVNLCIQVKDTGRGIKEEVLERITEGFYQSDGGRARKAGGLGLGLSIVCGLAAAMDGFMQIKSEIGEGTTITVSVPQKVADEAPCMAVEAKSDLCLVCYLKTEKYKVPEVREFYDTAITNLVRGLGVTLHRVFNEDDLNDIVSKYNVTHLFVSQDEYEQNPGLFETLSYDMRMIVFTNEGFEPDAKSKIRFVEKPFFGFPVAGLLNEGSQSMMYEDLYSQKTLLCPGVSVLVVDDEQMNLMVADGMFKSYGMMVKTAQSGREAIEICGNESFDIIFMDHMMPEMDGVETMKVLRQQSSMGSSAPKIVALTANAVSGAREMFLREGFDEFVAKPIEAPDMERVLKKILPRNAYMFVEEEERNRLLGPRSPESDLLSVVGELDVFSVLSLSGIDTTAGIRYCMNDKSFYNELLAKFVEETESKTNALIESFERKDWDDYRIRIHAIKSNSKMIGAMDLYEVAKRLEDAAKSKDADYIEKHHEIVITDYMETSETIGLAMGIDSSGASEDAKESAATGAKTMTAKDLSDGLKEVLDALSTYEADRAESIIAGFAGSVYEGRNVTEMLSEVSDAINDFDMKMAQEIVTGIIEKLQVGGEKQ